MKNKKTLGPTHVICRLEGGKKYPNESNPDTILFWKYLSDVFSDYTERREFKIDGDVGLLKIKPLKINTFSIQHIGNETNEIKMDEIVEISDEFNTTHSDFDEIIKNIKISDIYKVGLKPSVIQELKK